MKKIAVIIYPNFSLQEITCLTGVLAVWFGEKIDFISSENKEYYSEEGLKVIPTKVIDDVMITDYDCVILSGTINPLPALYDDKLNEKRHSHIGNASFFLKFPYSAIQTVYPLLLLQSSIGLSES